jgi:hypothetical protein
MKALVRYYVKNKLQGRYVVEVSIHEVGKSERYPDGIKYGLICNDLRTGEFVLLDNHHPKGHHMHINGVEETYRYVDDDQLVADFQRLVLTHVGVKL